MNKRHPLAVGLFSSLLAFAGCSSVPVPVTDTKAPVSIDKWCSVVTYKVCDRTAATCQGLAADFANSCKDTGTANCVNGRDANSPSGRTSGDLEQCLAKLEPLACKELQGMGGNPELVAACSAGAPSSSSTASPAAASPAPTSTGTSASP